MLLFTWEFDQGNYLFNEKRLVYINVQFASMNLFVGSFPLACLHMRPSIPVLYVPCIHMTILVGSL